MATLVIKFVNRLNDYLSREVLRQKSIEITHLLGQ